MAKKLLETEVNDEKIFLAKVELFEELINYDKVKTSDQRKALTYFLEYLFLIENKSLSEKFKEIKESTGGALKMSVDEIREKYLLEKGEAKGEIKGEIKGERKKLIKIFDKKLGKMSLDEIINFLELDEEESIFIKDYYKNKK